jgi:hypothetical protein
MDTTVNSLLNHKTSYHLITNLNKNTKINVFMHMLRSEEEYEYINTIISRPDIEHILQKKDTYGFLCAQYILAYKPKYIFYSSINIIIDNNILDETLCLVNDYDLIKKLEEFNLFDKITYQTIDILVKSNPDMLIYLSDKGYITPENTQDDNENILHELFKSEKNIRIIDHLIKGNEFMIEYFNNVNKKNMFPLHIACRNINTLKYICENNFTNRDQFLAVDINNCNIFQISILCFNTNVVKYIREHEFFTNDMFYNLTVDGKNILELVVCSYKFEHLKFFESRLRLNKYYGIFDYLIRDELITEEMLEKCTFIYSAYFENISSWKIINKNILSKTYDIYSIYHALAKIYPNELGKLLDMNVIDKDIFNSLSINGDHVIHFLCNNGDTDIILKVLKHEYFDINTIYKTDAQKYLILERLFSLGKENLDIIRVLFELDNNILNCKSGYQSIIHKFIELYFEEFIIEQFDKFTKEMFNIVDKQKMTILHKIAFYKKEQLFSKLLEKGFITKKMLLMVDNNKNNVLHINPKFIRILIEKHCFVPELVIMTNNNYETPDFEKYLDSEDIDKLLKDKNCVVQIILGTKLITRILELNCLELLIETQFCTHEVLNGNYIHHNGKYISLLEYLVIMNDIENINILLDNNSDICTSLNNANIITLNNNNIELFKKLIQIVQFNNEFFKSNIMHIIFKLGSAYIDELLNLPNWDDDYLNRLDSGNSVIDYVINNCNTETIQYIVNKYPQCTHTISRAGNTFLHNIYKKINSNFNIFLEEGLRDMHYHKNNVGHTPLNKIICKTKNKDLILFFMENIIDEQIMFNADNLGRNPIMNALIHHEMNLMNYDIVKDNLDRLLQVKDYEGNTLLFHAVRYNPSMLISILKDCDPSHIKIRNIFYETPILYASKYNGESVKHLLDSRLVEYDDLTFDDDIDEGNALSVSLYNQPAGVKYIMESDIFRPELNIFSKENIYESIALMKNNSLKYLLEVDLNTLPDMDELMKLVIKQNPHNVKTILDSKHFNFNTFKKNYNTYITMATDFQPMALVPILKHNYFNRLGESTTKQIIQKLRNTYGRISIESFYSSIYANTENIYDENDDTTCSICYTYNARINFNPCNHTACVACSAKINNCHLCRKEIHNKSFM